MNYFILINHHLHHQCPLLFFVLFGHLLMHFILSLSWGSAFKVLDIHTIAWSKWIVSSHHPSLEIFFSLCLSQGSLHPLHVFREQPSLHAGDAGGERIYIARCKDTGYINISPLSRKVNRCIALPSKQLNILACALLLHWCPFQPALQASTHSLQYTTTTVNHPSCLLLFPGNLINWNALLTLCNFLINHSSCDPSPPSSFLPLTL